MWGWEWGGRRGTGEGAWPPAREGSLGASAGEQDQGVLLRKGGSRLHLRGALEAAAFQSRAGGGCSSQAGGQAWGWVRSE